MSEQKLLKEELIKKLYHDIFRIRFVEEEIMRLYPSDVIKSPVHLSIGQESISVGVVIVWQKMIQFLEHIVVMLFI